MKIQGFKGAKWDRAAHEDRKAAAAAERAERKAIRDGVRALQAEVESLKKDKGGK